jgi:hypothetical protein
MREATGPKVEMNRELRVKEAPSVLGLRVDDGAVSAESREESPPRHKSHLFLSIFFSLD